VVVAQEEVEVLLVYGNLRHGRWSSEILALESKGLAQLLSIFTGVDKATLGCSVEGCDDEV